MTTDQHQAPEAMTDEQIRDLWFAATPTPDGRPASWNYARSLLAARDAMWSERLRAQPAGQPAHWTESEPVRLKESRAGRVYVAGPMTGLPEFNFPAFNAEAAALRAQGFAVLNPAEHGIVEGADWADYLRHDIASLASCERIHLLPGWSNSKGAKLEMHIAQTLGMTVTFADGAEPTKPAGQAGGEPARRFFAYHSDMGAHFFNGPDAEDAAKSLCESNLSLERKEAESTGEWADDRAESICWGVLPIFEGDPNTKLGSRGITAQGAQGEQG